MKGWRTGNTWHAIGYGGRDTPPEGWEVEWLETVPLSEIGDRPFHRGVFDREFWIKLGDPKVIEEFNRPGEPHKDVHGRTCHVQVFLNQTDGHGAIGWVWNLADYDVFVPCEAP